jgi:hypothetical protein
MSNLKFSNDLKTVADSTTTRVPDANGVIDARLYLMDVLEERHMTATVRTRSGSSYTIVSRPRVGVVMINDHDGQVYRGKDLTYASSSTGDYLVLHKVGGDTVLSTTDVIWVRILTN